MRRDVTCVACGRSVKPVSDTRVARHRRRDDLNVWCEPTQEQHAESIRRGKVAHHLADLREAVRAWESRLAGAKQSLSIAQRDCDSVAVGLDVARSKLAAAEAEVQP